MSRQYRSGNQEDASGDILIALVIGLYTVTFVLASPGLLILSVINLSLDGWITASWAGSQILVAALILSGILHVFLNSRDQRGHSRGWRMAVYILSAGWFPFSYYGLKIHYFGDFIGQIEWYYPMHYFMFAMCLIVILLLLGMGMLITGTGFLILGLPTDYSQAWAWAIFVQLLVSWLLWRLVKLDNNEYPLRAAWFEVNVLAMIVLCIFRYGFLSHWPHAALLHFFDHSAFTRE